MSPVCKRCSAVLSEPCDPPCPYCTVDPDSTKPPLRQGHQHQVIEALIDEMGRVLLAQPVRLSEKRRALVIVLDETASLDPFRTKSFVPNATPSEDGCRYRIERE